MCRDQAAQLDEHQQRGLGSVERCSRPRIRKLTAATPSTIAAATQDVPAAQRAPVSCCAVANTRSISRAPDTTRCFTTSGKPGCSRREKAWQHGCRDRCKDGWHTPRKCRANATSGPSRSAARATSTVLAGAEHAAPGHPPRITARDRMQVAGVGAGIWDDDRRWDGVRGAVGPGRGSRGSAPRGARAAGPDCLQLSLGVVSARQGGVPRDRRAALADLWRESVRLLQEVSSEALARAAGDPV